MTDLEMFLYDDDMNHNIEDEELEDEKFDYHPRPEEVE
jgi:hypothetical protein